jgi:hypothetical protein
LALIRAGGVNSLDPSLGDNYHSTLGDNYHCTDRRARLSLKPFTGECVMSDARGYLTKAKQCEQRASKVRCPETREWQMILARAYRMLAEAENEVVRQRPKMAA